MSSFYSEARLKNKRYKIDYNFRPAKCCANCENSRPSGYFRDRVECGNLIWEVGNDVPLENVCNKFERKR